MRSRGCFGVALEAESRFVGALEALQRTICFEIGATRPLIATGIGGGVGANAGCTAEGGCGVAFDERGGAERGVSMGNAPRRAPPASG